MSSRHPGYRMTLSTVASCFGASADGLNYAYNVAEHLIKPFVNESFYSHYGIALNQNELSTLWGLSGSIGAVGGIVGTFLVHHLAEKFGRKTAGLDISPCIAILGSLMQLFAKMCNSFEMLYLGRALCYCSLGIGIIIPIYITECALTSHRGFVGNLSVLLVYSWDFVGLLVAQSFMLGSETLWPLAVAYCTIPACLALGFSRILKESPKYLYISRKDERRTIQAIQFFHGPSVDAADLIDQYGKEAALSEQRSSISFREIFKEPHFRRGFWISCMIAFNIEAIGKTFAAMYSTSIFHAAGVSEGRAELTSLLIALTSLSCAVVSMFCVERVGRRPIVLSGVAMGAIANLMLTTTSASRLPELAIFAILLVKISHDALIGPVAHYIPSEVCPLACRSKAISTAYCIKNFFTILISQTFPILQKQINGLVYLFFVVVCILDFVWLWIYMPETKQLPVSNITAGLLDDDECALVDEYMDNEKPLLTSSRSSSENSLDIILSAKL